MMITRLKYRIVTLLIWCYTLCAVHPMWAQHKLQATGSGSAYPLINAYLAPGADAIESAECVHASFGEHIQQVWDEQLKRPVFVCYIHVDIDNDRCIKFDRQRIEIKSYGSSPDSLKATRGETVRYVWKFKLPIGFKASKYFTHIHQVKPVGGDDGDPLFTLTVRKGNPDYLEWVYVAETGGVKQKAIVAPLASIEGQWLEVEETITIGDEGSYAIHIKRVDQSTLLFTRTERQLRTIRANNQFVRPKWGIYRSLQAKEQLRDESLFFTDIEVNELK